MYSYIHNSLFHILCILCITFVIIRILLILQCIHNMLRSYLKYFSEFVLWIKYITHVMYFMYFNEIYSTNIWNILKRPYLTKYKTSLNFSLHNVWNICSVLCTLWRDCSLKLRNVSALHYHDMKWLCILYDARCSNIVLALQRV